MIINDLSKPAEIAESFGEYCARAKPILIGALEKVAVARVCIYYDGYGDQGAVGDIVATTSDNEDADISEDLDYPTYDNWSSVTRKTRGSLHAALTDFAEIVISHHYRGWENNEGAIGEINIDVQAGSFRIVHSTRVMTTENEQIEL